MAARNASGFVTGRRWPTDGEASAGGAAICSKNITSERRTTVNATERPEGRATAFVQVSGCFMRSFGVA